MADEQAPIPVTTRGSARFRHADARLEADEWRVHLQSSREVLPRGPILRRTRNPMGLHQHEWESLDTTMQDAFDSLLVIEARAVDDNDDDAMEAAARALARHCETHPSGHLLCAAHGLPVHHYLLDNQEPNAWGCRAGYTLSLRSVLTMVRSWQAVVDMAEHAAHRRTPCRLRQVEDVLQWPILDNNVWLGWAHKWQEKYGAITVDFQRSLVENYIANLEEQVRTRYAHAWLPQHGLRLTVDTKTDLGLYVAVLVGRLRGAIDVSGVSRFVACEYCNQPFQPRNSRQRYCPANACQREHRRVNKARARAARRPAEGEAR